MVEIWHCVDQLLQPLCFESFGLLEGAALWWCLKCWFNRVATLGCCLAVGKSAEYSSYTSNEIKDIRKSDNMKIPMAVSDFSTFVLLKQNV